MSGPLTAYAGVDVFDGRKLLPRHVLVVEGARIAAVLPKARLPDGAEVVKLPGGTLAPGYVDLQVNGGGGVMLNDAPTPETLATIAEAHARLGATSILPTLITDRPETTRAAIDAVATAVANGAPGILGLHLEGPHLAPARHGAHDPALIRPMGSADLATLTDAARTLPVLMVTLAPEATTTAQIRALAEAGAVVSLGHSDTSFAAARDAARSGARAVTHLFNAMSQLGSREPGLAGAALALGDLSAGLIADLIHVHPETIAAALRAKQGPGRIFLVSDAMATAGSRIDHFTLNGRRIERRDRRLTLQDGTLAGADLDMTGAVRNLVTALGLPLSQALAMATLIPAGLIGQSGRIGRLMRGRRADFIHLTPDLTLAGTWRGGKRVPG